MKAKTFHLAIIQQAPDLSNQNTCSVTFWQKEARWELIPIHGFDSEKDAIDFAFRKDVDLIREKTESYRATVHHLTTTPYVQGGYKTAILNASKGISKQMFYLKAQGCTVGLAIEAIKAINLLFRTIQPGRLSKNSKAYGECVMLMDAFVRRYSEISKTATA